MAPINGTQGAEWFAMDSKGENVAFKAPRTGKDPTPTLFLVSLKAGSAPKAVIPWDAAWHGPPIWASAAELLIAKSKGREFAILSLSSGRAGTMQPIRSKRTEEDRTFASVIEGKPFALMNVSWREGSARHRGFGLLNLRNGEFRLLSREGSHPRLVAGPFIVYARQQNLMAVQFDPKTLSLAGSSTVLDFRLWTRRRDFDGAFDISSDGTLLMPYGNQGWSDRGAVLIGQERGWSGTAGDREAFEGAVRAAPHGTALICDLADERGRREVWEVPLSDSFHARRVVSILGGDACSPVWSPDGTELAYARRAPDGGGIYRIRIDGGGSPELVAVVESGRLVAPTSWSSDGAWIACVDTTTETSIACAIHLKSDAANRSVVPLFSDRLDRRHLVFSPDARLIAYEADLGDGTAIYVQGWGVAGPLGDPLRVSAPGSKAPVWARKGRTLFFSTSKSRIEAATITTSPRLAASTTATPWDLVHLEIADNLYDLLPDGRLLGIRAGYGERGPSGFQLQHGLVSAIPMKMKDAER